MSDRVVVVADLPRRVLRASAGEVAAHQARLEKIAAKSGGRCLWPQERREEAGATVD